MLITITSFTTGTRDQMNRQLNQAIGSNLDALVVDLRDNTGGRYNAMAPALELLVPQGDMILGKYKSSEPVVLAESEGTGASFPLVVLTNANTADTAEVFAQVLKDMTGARVVGTKTAGDGKIQEFVKLSDGSAIQLTVGRYVTPGGLIIDGEGVKPDYEVKLEGEAIDWDNIDPEFDTQLKKALEVAQASVNLEAAAQ
jgi:carboxyl-terminal processing protease